MARLLKPLLIALIMAGFVAATERALLAADAAPQSGPLLGSQEFRPSSERPAGWRGDGSGRYPSAVPVTRWSAKEKVLWKSEVGTGHSSPVVVGQRVFITAEPDLLLCLDAETGRELWRKNHKFSDQPANPDAKGPKHSSQYGDATPTPVSDGKQVWVFYGTGIVAAYDLDGTRRWSNCYDQRQTTSYGRTASPVLIGDRLLVHFGSLVCLEAGTGMLLWKNDTAKASYGTPAPARIGSTDVVITPKGQVVRVADGKSLATDLGNCMYSSPIVQGRTVYFVDGDMVAVRLPEQAADQIECQELWAANLTGDFYASPVIDGGRIYTIDKAAKFYVIDANTGKTVLSRQLELPPPARRDGANVYPSLCLAGKHLFVSNDAGDTVLLEPGDPGTMVGAGCLPGGSGGTPTFSGQRMFVRGGRLLYCIGEP
jgi:outer membrane protein assembly factor BamB